MPLPTDTCTSHPHSGHDTHSNTCANAHIASGTLSQPTSQSEGLSHLSAHAPHPPPPCKQPVSTPCLSHQPAHPRTSVQCVPHPATPASGFPLGVQRPQWPGIKMQRGGAGRVSTASPGAHGARHRRPARPEPRGQCAEEQVLEAQPRRRRAAAAQVRPGPEEGRAGGRGRQPAPPPPRAWSLERRARGAASWGHPGRCWRGSAVPGTWCPRGREKKRQRTVRPAFGDSRHPGE